MHKTYAGPLAALALGMVAAGCGGGGGGGSAGGGDIPLDPPRSFEFTVAVPGATQRLDGVTFFKDQALNRPGVEIRSSSNALFAETSASLLNQQGPISRLPDGFGLAVHFDASGSINRNTRDALGLRFGAARALIESLASTNPTTRVYTFRSTYTNGFLLMDASMRPTAGPGPFPANDAGAREQGIRAAQDQGAEENSPAFTATHNIIGGGGCCTNSLPGNNHAMLLLTDGENNNEDPAVVPGCSEGESSTPNGCGDSSAIQRVADRANARGVRVFVAGLSNNDQALSRFEDLARRTNAVFVKATSPASLDEQFQSVGRLMLSGGVVVNGMTGDVAVPSTGNPGVTGWMRFDRPSGGCPQPADAVTGTDFCRIKFP